MIIKTSKVVSVQFLKTWESRKGDTFYAHQIQMENGDCGEYSSKTEQQTKFVEGEQTEYEYHPHDSFPKIKPHYARPQFTGNAMQNENTMIPSVAIKASAVFNAGRSATAQQVVKDARVFAAFINEQPAETAPPAKTIAQLKKDDSPEIVITDSEDSPF
tara:strand:+ start:541 stop:1017 length:477 start_codon:yes stop_codon:yes gene_type:complete